jgi:hypothetical protein
MAALLAALWSGCSGNDCMRGQIPECRGNELWQCDDPEDAPATWHKQSCGAHRYCRAGPGFGTCAAEPDPEPACLSVTLRTGTACTSDGRVVSCGGEYVTDVQATCAAPELCLSNIPYPTCVVSTTPDPRCPASPTLNTVCMGDRAVTCSSGYLVQDKDCGPGLCYTPPDLHHSPRCVTSLSTDPRCPPLPPPYTSGETFACDGNAILECIDGLSFQSADCGTDTCHQSGSIASCAPG